MSLIYKGATLWIPIYFSLQNINTESNSHWLSYWIVYGLYHLLYPIHFFMDWIPYWDMVKTLFFIYVMTPGGAENVLSRVTPIVNTEIIPKISNFIKEMWNNPEKTKLTITQFTNLIHKIWEKSINHKRVKPYTEKLNNKLNSLREFKKEMYKIYQSAIDDD